MAEEISELVIRYSSDKQALAESLRDNETLRARVEALDDTLGDLGPTTRANVNALIERFAAGKATVREVEQALDDLERQVRDLDNLKAQPVVEVVTPSGRPAREDLDDLTRRYNDDFDAVSRRVALAGDAQSNLGALRGLAGAAGFTGVSGGLDIAGEIIVLTEELPRLKASLAGLPAAVKAAVDAIGIGTLVGGGVLVAAIAGLGLVAQESARLHQEAREEARAYVQTLEEETEARAQLRDAISLADPNAIGTRVAELRARQNDVLETQYNPIVAELNNLLEAQRDVSERLAEAGDYVPGTEAYDRFVSENMLAFARENRTTGGRFVELETQVGDLNRTVLNPLTDQIRDLEGAALAGAQQIKALNEPLERQQQLRSLVRDGSSDDVRQQFKDLSDDANVLYTTLVRTEEQITAARDSGNTALADELEIYYQSTQAKLDAAEAEGKLLYEALPLIEAREAEARALDRVKAAQQDYVDDLARQTQLRLQTNTLVRTGSVDQVDSRLADIDAEISALLVESDALRQRAGSSEIAAQRLGELTERINVLGEESRRLTEVRPDVALRQLREETQKLDEQLTTSISRLTAARDQRLVDLADSLDQGLADLQGTFFEQQREDQKRAEDQLEKFHTEERRRVKEHSDNLLRLQRDGQIRIEDAAADGNIRAALEAERDLNNQLKDEQDKFDTQTDQRKEDLDNLKDSLDEQEQERARDYQKRYNQLVDQNRREVNATLAKYQQDVNLQVQAYNAELNNLYQAVNAEVTLKHQANTAVLVATAEWANRMIGIANNMVRQAQGLSPVVIPDYVYVQDPFASGFLQRASGGDTPARRLVNVNENGTESGLNRRGQFMIFDDNTYVLDASKTRRLLEGDTSVLPGGRRAQGGGDIYVDFGGITIPIQGANADPAAIAAQVEQRFLTRIIPKVRQIRLGQGNL